MTAWDTAADPNPLLRVVWPEAADVWDHDRARELAGPLARRLRLFAVAAARQVWDLLPTDPRSAVLVAERFADGTASEHDLRAAAVLVRENPVTAAQHAVKAAGCAALGYTNRTRWVAGFYTDAVWNPLDAGRNAAKALATRAAQSFPPPHSAGWHAAWTDTFLAAVAEQADYVRDIFPPPGPVPAVAPEWLTSTVVALARQMYETRDFTPMPILADALQDAGCDDERVLGHCREPAPHVRGCWVTDLLRT